MFELNFFSPEFQADPFPTYAKMREAGLSKVQPMGFYAVSRHADVQRALRSSDLFSSAGFVEAFEPPWVGYNPGAHTMLSLDPPDHTKLRVLVNKAFSGQALARVENKMKALAAQLVESIAPMKEADVVESFALPLTAGSLGLFLDLDPAFYGRFKRWSDSLSSVTPTPRDEAHVADVHATIAEVQQYLGELIAARRANLGDDVVSALIRAEVDGRSLDEKELVSFLVLLIVAGLETTVNLISKSMLRLADEPALLDRIRKEPAMISRFLEEMLRWDPPTHTLFRVTKSDVPVDGGVIPSGSFVMLMLAAANRDPSVFPDAERFELGRDTQGHVAFGYGAHQCIGLQLARLEGRLAFDALLARVGRVERTADPVQILHTMTVRGPAHLRLRLGA